MKLRPSEESLLKLENLIFYKVKGMIRFFKRHISYSKKRF